ncbi:MAG: hypothetical protein ACOYLI_06845 [Synechococcus lacustris]
MISSRLTAMDLALSYGAPEGGGELLPPQLDRPAKRKTLKRSIS